MCFKFRSAGNLLGTPIVEAVEALAAELTEELLPAIRTGGPSF
jgi:hypothetical protein